MAQGLNRTARFEDLTETTGIPLSAEGADMMATRYAVAAGLAAGLRVLELGCGAGQGLGLIGREAGSVVGADYSLPLLRSGRAHYGTRVPFVRLSADALPFRSAAFDLVLFFEASYYVPDMARSFREIARVLAPVGTVLFVNANPERPDFIQSPHSVHYHSADEFRAALAPLGFTVEARGAFPVEAPGGARSHGPLAPILSLARRALEALGLVPKTLRGRARVKRLIYGKLREVPAELGGGFGAVAPLDPLPAGPARGYKVIYVSGHRRTAE
jgi:SAM-dependent methyltransferase